VASDSKVTEIERAVMAQLCSFNLSANLRIFLYAILQMHFKDKAPSFRHFLVLENEK